MPIPKHDDLYEGPPRDPPLHESFDRFLRETHAEQPITIQELLDSIQSMLYRMRWNLSFPELVVEIRELLRHNERHISTEDWLMMTDDGEHVPLVTPEMRVANPDKAALTDQLMQLIVEGTPDDAGELFDDS